MENVFETLNQLSEESCSYVPQGNYERIHSQRTIGFTITDVPSIPLSLAPHSSHLNMSVLFPVNGVVCMDEDAVALGLPAEVAVSTWRTHAIIANGALHQQNITIMNANGEMRTVELPQRLVSDWLVKQSSNLDFLLQIAKQEIQYEADIKALKAMLPAKIPVNLFAAYELDFSNADVQAALLRHGFTARGQYSPRSVSTSEGGFEKELHVVEISIAGLSTFKTKKGVEILNESTEKFKCLTLVGQQGQLKLAEKRLKEIRLLLSWLRLARFLEGDKFQNLPLDKKGNYSYDDLIIKVGSSRASA